MFSHYDVMLAAGLSPTDAIQPQLNSSTMQLFRITSDAPTTTSTTSTTSTSTTSTSTTSTTTPPPCMTRVFAGIAIEAEYPITPGWMPIVTIERSQERFALMSPRSVSPQVNDIVLAARANGQWWIMTVYGNCPQVNVTTTTTSTSTSTTSTTTPQYAPRPDVLP